MSTSIISYFVFFNDTATTEIYTLSLHDALPISPSPDLAAPTAPHRCHRPAIYAVGPQWRAEKSGTTWSRSGEHTSELQSRQYLVCRLLLVKKKNKNIICYHQRYILTRQT